MALSERLGLVLAALSVYPNYAYYMSHTEALPLQKHEHTKLLRLVASSPERAQSAMLKPSLAEIAVDTCAHSTTDKELVRNVS
jgi:hypothetical protein